MKTKQAWLAGPPQPSEHLGSEPIHTGQVTGQWRAVQHRQQAGITALEYFNSPAAAARQTNG